MPNNDIPQVNLTVNERNLGLVPPPANGLHVKVGIASKGPFTLTQVNTPQALFDTFGTGPVVESSVLALSEGAPLLVMRAATDTAGVAGAVTMNTTATNSGATVAVAGNAVDAYSVIVEITQPGATLAANTAAFKYTLDGGTSYSSDIAVPVAGTYPLGETGLTLTFAAGSGAGFVKGATYTFAVTAPSTNLTHISDAVAAVLSSPVNFAFIHIVGAADTAANAAAMAATLGQQLMDAMGNYRYCFILLECPDVSTADAKAAFVGFANSRVMVAYGQANYLSSVQRGKVMRRSSGWAIASRLSAIPPGQKASWVGYGALPGFVQSIVYDEQVVGGMDRARFATLRTHIGRQGFYITGARMMSAADSDVQDAVHRRVLDIASDRTRLAVQPYLDQALATEPDTGRITEAQARAIQSVVDNVLEPVLVDSGDAQAAFSVVDRTNDFFSTGELRVTANVRPFNYARTISATVGLSRTSPTE